VPDSSTGVPSLGLFIQSVDRLRGVTPVIDGLITLHELSPPEGDVELRCADGTEIHGRFVARPGSRRPLAFEREHAADLAELEDTLAAEVVQGP
jgi:hypothetical protein